MSSISDKKRIVIKLGSSTLTHKTGRLNLRKMDSLIKVIADLHNSGKEIIMVSSGSIALGVGKLGFKERQLIHHLNKRVHLLVSANLCICTINYSITTV